MFHIVPGYDSCEVMKRPSRLLVGSTFSAVVRNQLCVATESDMSLGFLMAEMPS